MRRIWGAVLALALIGAGTQLQARPLGTPSERMGKVALTFDDLPGYSLFNDQAWLDFINRECCAG
jgi:peptidoglycan/xylan/chitin deacetylase (PgdA/CDA1 family)